MLERFDPICLAEHAVAGRGQGNRRSRRRTQTGRRLGVQAERVLDSSGASGREALVVLEQPAQPVAADDAAGGRSRIGRRPGAEERPVAHALMWAFRVVMLDEFAGEQIHVARTEDDEVIEALVLEGPDEPLDVRVQVRRPEGQFEGLHAAALQRLIEGGPELVIPPCHRL